MPYSHQELVDHYNRQPAKRIGSMVLIFSQKDELLIVKPTYKTGWSLVGGTVDEDESPLVAAAREVGEEIGLVLPVSRLAFRGIRYAHPKDDLKDYIQIFFSTELTSTEELLIKPREKEISEFKFIPTDEIMDYADHLRMQAVAALLTGNSPAYMENEELV